MNILDWGVLALFVLSILLGYLRGGIKEVLGLGGWLGGLVLAFLGAPLLAPFLTEWILPATLRWVAAYIIIFIAVRLVAWGLGKVLAELVLATKLGIFDKLLGLVFGGVRAVVLSLFITVLCIAVMIPRTSVWQASSSGAHLVRIVATLVPFFPAAYQSYINKQISYIDK